MDEADRDYLADMLRYAEVAVSILQSAQPAELGPDAPKLLAKLHAVQMVGEAARQIGLEAPPPITLLRRALKDSPQ
jgi:uncharacterized protein with HEPN domain